MRESQANARWLYFENQIDDGINVHGIYARVVGRIADHAFKVELVHHQQRGLIIFDPGSRMSLLARLGAWKKDVDVEPVLQVPLD